MKNENKIKAIINLLEKTSGKQVILEDGMLGQGMSPQAKATDVEQSDKEYIASKQKKMPKMPKVFTIKQSRPGAGGRFGGDSRVSYYTGTLEYLIKKVFGYTLEVGASYQHERGNKKINQNPKTAQQLAINLYNAKNNAARDGYSGYDYEVVPNEENPEYGKESVQEAIKTKAIIKLIEKYSNKKVVLTEGTWSVPNTEEKAGKLMSYLTNLKYNGGMLNTNKLNRLVGDDSLFDQLDDINQSFSHEVIVTIQSHIKNMLKLYKTNPENFKDKFSPRALEILTDIAKGNIYPVTYYKL